MILNNPLLAGILDQHYDAILFLDPVSLDCVYYNYPACNLFNLNHERKTVFPFRQLFSDETSERRFMEAIQGEGGEILLDRFPLRRLPDQLVICGIKGKRLQVDGQNWLFCTFRDVSERIRLEERERVMQAQLIQANKMTSLGTMASGVAHEINNPNNYILSNAQMVSDVWSDLATLLEDQPCIDADTMLGGLNVAEAMNLVPKLLSGIIEGAGRINAIVSRMKKYARPVQQENRDKVNINRVVEFAVSMLEREIRKRTEHFSLELEENVPDFFGYEEQIEQVLINLIHNALQALRNSGAGVKVTTRRLDDRVEVSVADEGEGIPEETRSRIFEPFYTTKQEKGGTGLGLYISYEIVREHEGEMIVESETGKGTVMTLRFPVSDGGEQGTGT